MRRCPIIFAIILALFLVSCVGGEKELRKSSCRYARYFDIVRLPYPHADTDSLTAVVTISPYDGTRDTLVVGSSVERLVCMSTSQVAGLSAIGADSVISAVSGLRYISDPEIRRRALSDTDPVYDIGYESSLDYERIVTLDPDVVLTYTVSGAEPQYISRLRSLGVRVLVLHDHLEDHPLARAEYIRMYGAITGRSSVADSIYASVCARYDSLRTTVPDTSWKVRVLMNVPYGDAWYIPGADSYMARLVDDAGGEVLGARSGTTASRTISLEEAYELSQQADIWLNPGPCRTRLALESYHHSFRMFGPLAGGLPIYNNTLRTTPEGGNDFWESGSVRPDLILEDLITIFSSAGDDGLKYHFHVK